MLVPPGNGARKMEGSSDAEDGAHRFPTHQFVATAEGGRHLPAKRWGLQTVEVLVASRSPVS